MLWQARRGLIAGRGALDAAAVAAFTTLDPVNKGSSITLAGGNLRATNSAFAFNNVRSLASHATGKYYFEAMINVSAYSFDGLGIANAAEVLNAAGVGGSFDSVGYRWQGQEVRINGAAVASGWPVDFGGVVIAVAADLTNKRIWFKSAVVTSWNNSGSADPATNVGGIDLTTLNAGPYFAFLTLAQTTDDYTANFGASAYTYTPPSGFGNW